MALKIGAGDVERIHEHALEAYPEECAGALVGMDAGGTKVVVDVWRAENTHEEERSRRFLIEPLKIKEFEDRAEARRRACSASTTPTPTTRPSPRSTTGTTPGPATPT